MMSKVNMESLWKAVIKQETGHLEDDPEARASALGDMLADGKYRAVGIAQIWECVVTDVNALGFDFKPEDRLSPEKSHEIFKHYLRRWSKAYKTKTGKEADYEALARMWNGGPDGWKKKSTNSYWKSVRKNLEELGVKFDEQVPKS